MIRYRPLVVFAVAAALFHFANAPMLPLVVQKLALANPGRETGLPSARSSWRPAGLLNHRRVTTHRMFSELLATAYPSIQVDSNLLFARDENIYSSGGVTAGIDLA